MPKFTFLGHRIATNVDDSLLASNEQSRELLASAARTATGQGAAVTDLKGYNAATFLLDITVDEQTAADTLNVAIQRLLPDGSTWDTIARFTQAAGDAGASKQVIDYLASNDEAARATDESTTSPTLAAGNSKNTPWADQLRVIWIINDDSGNASFTFSVTGDFEL